MVYVSKIGMRLEDFRTRHLNTSIGSICTGSDAAAYVMETLLGKDGCEELYACDNDPAAEQFILHNFNPKRFWRDSCEPSIGGRCQVLGGFATPLLVGPQMLFASSTCKDNSILNGKRKTALLLPWCSEDQRPLHDISAAIDAEEPDVYVGENLVALLQPYNSDLCTSDVEVDFVRQYPAPIDYLKRGVTPDGKIVGLELKPKYHFLYFEEPAANHGNPQHRNRLWYVLALKSICTPNAFQYFVYLVKEVFVLHARCSLMELMTYVNSCGGPSLLPESKQERS